MEFNKYLHTAYDDQLIHVPNLKWLPWVGNNYIRTNLLILGESQYEDGDNWQENNSDATRILIGVRFAGSIGRLYKNVEKVLLSSPIPTVEEGNKLWTSVVYYNLVQRLMSSIKERPSQADFDNGWKIFFSLVDVLKPTICIVLGKSSCGRLGYYLNNNETAWQRQVDDFYQFHKVINLSNNQHKLKLIFINHPSGSRGFDYKYWADLISKNEPNLRNKLIKNA